MYNGMKQMLFVTQSKQDPLDHLVEKLGTSCSLNWKRSKMPNVDKETFLLDFVFKMKYYIMLKIF